MAGVGLGAWIARAAREGSLCLLRPPGAGFEEDFLAACTRCGQCVEACPTDVLKLARYEAGTGFGTPHVTARSIPCNLCAGQAEMRCIAVCPTEALEPLEGRRDVKMGVAVIDHDLCLAWLGVSCRACWHACPYPTEAIVMDELGRAVVVPEVCVGCGLCEHVCLTDPSAIVIKPKSALPREATS